MSINWYPGHMAKTRRFMQEDLKLVDVVCEIADARIPVSSRNPDLDRMAQNKRRMLVLNRADQADPKETANWVKFYRSQGYTVMETNSKTGDFRNEFTNKVRECCADLLKRLEDKGQVGKHIRIMIIGIPNVGKSTFINRLLGKKSAVAADKPGFALAFTGSIRDEILDLEDLACRLILQLDQVAPGALQNRYGIEEICREQPYDTLTEMARKRGFLAGRGEYDTERMAKIFLDEFRGGKLGRITLERAPIL